MTIVLFSLSLFVAAMFAQAGWSKLVPANQNYYQQVIQAYSVVPTSLPQPVLRLLPRMIGCIELTTAGLILVPAFTKIGLLLAAFLIGFYTLLFVKQLLDGKADIDCGCAGPGAQSKVSGLLVARNVVLLYLVAIALFGLPSAGFSFHSLSLPLAIMIGLIYLSADQLIANNQKIQLLSNT